MPVATPRGKKKFLIILVFSFKIFACVVELIQRGMGTTETDFGTQPAKYSV